MAYRRYQKALKQAGAVDFDDLLLCTEELFTRFDDVRQAEAGRFSHLLIDEYQDTNASQYRIVRALADAHRNLCVVGDDDQSIYGWRGAEVSHILRFKHDWPDAKVVRLEENYRSTEAILTLANRLIKFNKLRHDKVLRQRAAAARSRRLCNVPTRRRRRRQSWPTSPRGWPTAGPIRASLPSCFARTSNPGRSRPNCARRSCLMCSSAACRFTIARKCATSWPT